MLLGQAIHIDLLLCPSLIKVEMMEKKRRDKQKKMKKNCLKLFEGLTVWKKINSRLFSKDRNSKSNCSLLYPLLSPSQRKKMNNDKRDGKEYYPNLNPKLVVSHTWNTGCISHHDTWRKDSVWRKPIHKMNKIFIRGYFSSHKVFCGNFHSRKKLSAPYKCIDNTVKGMKRHKGLSHSGKHTLCILEKQSPPPPPEKHC